MIEITAEQAIESLRKVVKGNEEKVVGCVYVDPEGKPACIVANALVDCGAPIQALYDLDRSHGNAFYGSGDGDFTDVQVSDILERHDVYMSEIAYRVFSTAQQIQDGDVWGDDDRRWGRALAEAELVYANA